MNSEVEFMGPSSMVDRASVYREVRARSAALFVNFEENRQFQKDTQAYNFINHSLV
jgi:hypothetical protein